jgi:hypothetical protein
MVDSTKYLNAVQSFVGIAGPTAPSEKKDQSKAEKPQATINILIARFLADEIVQRFTPERLKEIKSFDPDETGRGRARCTRSGR